MSRESRSQNVGVLHPRLFTGSSPCIPTRGTYIHNIEHGERLHLATETSPLHREMQDTTSPCLNFRLLRIHVDSKASR